MLKDTWSSNLRLEVPHLAHGMELLEIIKVLIVEIVYFTIDLALVSRA